jgi:membrane-associated phospholipid phosphatase
MTRAAHACAVALLGATLLVSPRAGAEEPRSPYRFRLGLDLPLVGFGLAGTSLALVEPRPPPCLPACEPPSTMNALDARVLGRHSPSAHTAADITVFALMLAPHAVNLVATGGRDGAWLEDAAISLEAVLVAQAGTQLVKHAAGRWAPIVYDERVPLEERTSADAVRSFWSGHTATAFAAATSFAVSYWLRHPRDPWRWVVLATLESAALSAGLLKMRAGYHYPTDIAAGALAGISAGVLVPALHARF